MIRGVLQLEGKGMTMCAAGAQQVDIELNWTVERGREEMVTSQERVRTASYILQDW